MKRTRTLMSAAAVAVTALAVAPVALAAPSPVDVVNLSGTWKSASVVIDPSAPYFTLTLKAACKPARCYSGVVQFHYQDGTVGKPIKVGVASDSNPMTFGIVFPGGAFVSNTKVLHGHIGNDGSLQISHCWTYMKPATKATAEDFCDFPTI